MKQKLKLSFDQVKNKFKIFFRNPWVKLSLINLGLGILFYFIVIFSTIKYLDVYSNHGEEIAVPNLVGKKSSVAKMQLEDMGLSYEILDSIYDPSLPNGIVKQQMIEPTSISKVKVKENRIIGLRLSKKTELTEMPDLVFKHVDFAQGILENRGFSSRIQYKPTKEANGSVLDQKQNGKSITKGTRIPIGSEITLIVGQNEVGVLVELPNVVGMNYQDAISLLGSKGLESISTICNDCENLQDTLSAVVFGQSPEYMPEKTVERAQQIVVLINAGANQTEEPIE
ncbi:MAG: PASTA domain-containing protein [Flavobacteriales bacterium]|nr:MAG: PASTA domain-containing protein [Flavobacteriales bacterium]